MSSSRLRVIDCEYLQPRLAAAYLRVEDGEAAFVETGTSKNLPALLDALRDEGLAPEAVRYVVVTHAHLDHAGGAGALMQRLPRATLVAHPRAARHLVDPSKLVASARGVYGDARFDALYGALPPVDAARVRALEDGQSVPFGRGELAALHTRGHANHHMCVVDRARDAVFTGDTFGLVYPDLQRGARFAFPSTSPTDFDAAEARRSIDAVLGLGCARVIPTHFGEFADAAVIAAQLRGWIDVSEAAVEACASMEEGAREAHAREVLTAEMARRLADAGIELGDDERALLALDLGLNAQGLAWAAGRRQRN